MEFVTLNNGMKLPLVGFGTWTLRGEECEKSVCTAIESGYRLIDTAQMYDNEKEVGMGIKASKIEREKLIVTTKICRPNNSYEKTKEAIQQSLKNLQLDYIDLMLIHEPYEESQEMYRALKEAYKEGSLRAIGISNFDEKTYKKFVEQCEIIPAINQVEAHVFFGHEKLQETMDSYGTKMEAWSPFTAGKKDIFHNQVLMTIGNKYGKTAAQIALKFLVQRKVIVIPKSSKPERMIANLDLFDFQLSEQEMQQIRGLDEGVSLFGWY